MTVNTVFVERFPPLSSLTQTSMDSKRSASHLAKCQSPFAVGLIGHHITLCYLQAGPLCVHKGITKKGQILHVNPTQRQGWECLIQHLESIHQFLIDGNYC